MWTQNKERDLKEKLLPKKWTTADLRENVGGELKKDE